MQEPKALLITGANKGLGLEFVRQFSEKKYQVYCCCRDLHKCGALLQLARRFPYIKVFQVDVTNTEQIEALADELKDKPLDVLINNAGIFGVRDEHIGGDPIDVNSMLEVFKTNAIAPVKITEALLPNLCLGKDKKIVAISSSMGSLNNISTGGDPAYRASKAALNALMKTMSFDLRELGLQVLLLHPGWVKTDMGTNAAPLSPAESITGMIKVIESFSGNSEAMFLNYKGEPVPW